MPRDTVISDEGFQQELHAPKNGILRLYSADISSLVDGAPHCP